MEVVLNQTFFEQCREYRFCYTCEHCAHFDDLTGQCLHGYPNRMHRLKHYDPSHPPATVLFCKDFDLV